jgi:hypothetical protein
VKISLEAQLKYFYKMRVSKIFSPTWPNAPKNPRIADVVNNIEKETWKETWREIVDATSPFYLDTWL